MQCPITCTVVIKLLIFFFGNPKQQKQRPSNKPVKLSHYNLRFDSYNHVKPEPPSIVVYNVGG